MVLDLNVTRRQLSLGSRDSWSGWRAKTWTTSTIEMIIVPKGATRLAMIAGVYPKLDAVGLTVDAISHGDQIYDANTIYWTVETVKPQYIGDSLVYYECDLIKELMYQADAGATTWSKTRGSDPRYRTKYWLDTYLRTAQITKDNDSTTANFGVLFNNPPYPLDLEFRGSSNMNGLYVVDQPNSTPLPNADLSIRGYEEHVPIHIVTVDSTSCTGTALQWKMEAELRYVCENYLSGSLRTPDRRGKGDRELGGMWLYDTEYIVTYKRDTST